jgi:hypothetical protein
VEEGPEPHELIEQTVEQHHHAEHVGQAASPRELRLSAMTAAVLAVCAALASLLSGHAANQAILSQTRASDHWAHFQAKSTKGHLYEVGRQMLEALGSAAPTAGTDRLKQVMADFQNQTKKYDAEKEELQKQAQELESESAHELHKHHDFALAVASFQVGVVLSSISILVRYRALFLLSILAGLVGAGLVFVGLIA